MKSRGTELRPWREGLGPGPRAPHQLFISSLKKRSHRRRKRGSSLSLRGRQPPARMQRLGRKLRALGKSLEDVSRRMSWLGHEEHLPLGPAALSTCSQRQLLVCPDGILPPVLSSVYLVFLITALKRIQLLPIPVLFWNQGWGGGHKRNVSNKQSVLVPTAYEALSRPYEERLEYAGLWEPIGQD